MAQISYRANLSAAIFPMTLARAGRSVIIPGPDQNFDRRVDPQGEQKDAGIPQVIYMENVMPTANGYQSVGYLQTGTMPFVDMAILEIKMPGAIYPEVLAFNVGGTEVYRKTLNTWEVVIKVGAVATFPTESGFSFAVVQGVVYIMAWNSIGAPPAQLYTYKIIAGAGTLENVSASVTPAGLLTVARGITGSYNYLIAYTDTPNLTVLWSSTLTPTDFNPSLVTGAGSTGVGNIQGKCVCLRACPEGFIIYTDNNAVAAEYTGNARYPWRFTPVKDSVGISAPWNVYSDSDESVQMSIGRAGIVRQVSSKVSTAVAPEISEYMERVYQFDKFDYVLDTFVAELRSAGLAEDYRIYVFASRYIFVSYRESTVEPAPGSPGIYDAVFVYDMNLNRYGKLRKRHSHIITSPQVFSGRLFVGLLDTFAQKMYEVNLNMSEAEGYDTKGVLLLGKFQYVRSRDLCLDEISLESGQTVDSNVGPQPYPGNFHVRTFQTRNGKDFLPAETPYYRLEDSSAAVANYFSSAEGRNISVLIKGTFDLCSVELVFHVGGAS